jgi:O-antigen/teichoic acid export membrane protein
VSRATRAAAHTAAPERSLSRTASRGAAVTASGLWLKTLIQLVSTMVLARLLDPGDFGLIAMIMAIIGVADLVRDFGMTGAIIQARSLSRKQWSSLLWFSLALGSVLTVVVALCAPLIAALYDEQRLIILTLAIAPTLLLNSLAMPMQAAAQRDMRFGTLALIDIVAMIVGVVLSVIAAVLGFGVWSLVILGAAGQVYRLIALWVATRLHWGPPRISREISSLLTTGGSIFGVQLLNYASRNMDNVIIGQQLGPAALGQYSRAYSLFLLPQQQLNGPIGRVALPVLSRLQDDAERYRRYVRGSMTIIGYLSLPTYAIAAAVAYPLIEVLLGPGWEQAAGAFALLAIAGMAQAIGNVQGWLYITLGRAHRQLVYFLITRPIVIAMFFVGVWWNGIEGLALLYGLTSMALLLPGYWAAIHGTFLRGWHDITAPLVRPVVLAPLVFAAAYSVTFATAALIPLLQVLIGGLTGAAVLALASLIPAYRRDYLSILEFVKKARGPKAPPTNRASSDDAPPSNTESGTPTSTTTL